MGYWASQSHVIQVHWEIPLNERLAARKADKEPSRSGQGCKELQALLGIFCAWYRDLILLVRCVRRGPGPSLLLTGSHHSWADCLQPLMSLALGIRVLEE